MHKGQSDLQNVYIWGKKLVVVPFGNMKAST